MIIYGTELSAKLKEKMKNQAAAWKEEGRRLPCLSVILVGDNPASQSYVKSKGNACHAIGIENRTIVLDGGISQEELLAVIEKENANPEVDGILVQLPLPAHLDEISAIDAISPDKDVDGLHPVNAGRSLRPQQPGGQAPGSAAAECQRYRHHRAFQNPGYEEDLL